MRHPGYFGATGELYWSDPPGEVSLDGAVEVENKINRAGTRGKE